MFGDTLPSGSKIYAIRAPALSSSKQIRDQPRTVGIVFNWKNVIGFRRAGDNAKAFPILYGNLESAYLAAQKFMAQPSLHEGPLDVPVFQKMISTSFGLRTNVSTKCVVSSLAVSLLILCSYYMVLVVQEWYGCVYSSKLFTKSVGSGMSNICRHLLHFQLHIQDNASIYTDMLLSQLKILLVLSIRYVVDEWFNRN